MAPQENTVARQQEKAVEAVEHAEEQVEEPVHARFRLSEPSPAASNDVCTLSAQYCSSHVTAHPCSVAAATCAAVRHNPQAWAREASMLFS